MAKAVRNLVKSMRLTADATEDTSSAESFDESDYDWEFEQEMERERDISNPRMNKRSTRLTTKNYSERERERKSITDKLGQAKPGGSASLLDSYESLRNIQRTKSKRDSDDSYSYGEQQDEFDEDELIDEQNKRMSRMIMANVGNKDLGIDSDLDPDVLRATMASVRVGLKPGQLEAGTKERKICCLVS